MKTNFIMAALALAVFLSYSCKKQEACTEEFRLFMLDVKDKDGKEVVLDDSYTRNLVTGESFRFDDQNIPEEGRYILLTDSQLNATQKDGSPYDFIGLQDDVEVVRETFVIKNDGCHIILVSGNTSIVLK
ncbi:MAG: hypothetical protein ACK4ND_06160 [Cytophagaceae bacterium]